MSNFQCPISNEGIFYVLKIAKRYRHWTLGIRHWKLGILLITVFCILAVSAYSSDLFDPSDVGIGARPLAMGRAFVGVSNNGSAIFTNPAGLALSKNFKIVSMAGNLMSEVPYQMLGWSAPLFNGNCGVGYVRLNVSGISEYILVGITPEATGGESSFSNSVLNLSYATDWQDIPVINNFKAKAFRDAKIGGSLKFINQEYLGSSSFKTGNVSGFDVNLGVISSINENLAAGLMFKNIIPGKNLSSDELPLISTLGFCAKFPWYGLLTALDLEVSRTVLYHLGFEWTPIRFLSIRCGFDQKPDANQSITNFTGGIGINTGKVAFDYAYHTYSDVAEFSTHYFSLSYSGDENFLFKTANQSKTSSEVVQEKPARRNVVYKPIIVPSLEAPQLNKEK